MSRDPNWRQATPAHQMACSVMSLRGCHANYKDGIISKEKMLEELDKHVEEMARLSAFLYKNRWDAKPDGGGKLVKRIDPRNLDPNYCCFIFSFVAEDPFFRIYSENRESFKDYKVRGGVTPFVKLIDDDVELKEYRFPDGTISREMDFPAHVLNPKLRPLQPGEEQNLE